MALRRRVMNDDLPEDWEAVVDPEGRTYWWNTCTNETTWTKPVAVVATKGIAAGYVAKIQSPSSPPVAKRFGSSSSSRLGSSASSIVRSNSGSDYDPVLEQRKAFDAQYRSDEGVGRLTKKFSQLASLETGDPTAMKTSSALSPSSPSPEARSQALTVDGIRKYREAKAKMLQEEAGKKKPPPPKVDLYK